MAQKSEAVFVVERSRILIARSNNEHTLSAWEPVRVAEAAINDASIMVGRADELGYPHIVDENTSPFRDDGVTRPKTGRDLFEELKASAGKIRPTGEDTTAVDALREAIAKRDFVGSLEALRELAGDVCECPRCVARRDGVNAPGIDPGKPGDDMTATAYVMYLPGVASSEMPAALAAVIEERCEQVFVHGRTPQQDDTINTARDLARGAISFLYDGLGQPDMANSLWPWPNIQERFPYVNRSEDYTVAGSKYERSLVKAAAMLVAELERLKRIQFMMAQPGAPVFDGAAAAGGYAAPAGDAPPETTAQD